MKVSEIFRSVQGEGRNIGTPAIFLRMALCNLACGWCDTKYTWDWKHFEYSKEVLEMSEDQVFSRLVDCPERHLVLTGGEPLMQQRDLVPLLHRLDSVGFYIEVETNGTIKPTEEILDYVDQWNVSPKLDNSANSVEKREHPDCYEFFAKLGNSSFKYVVDNETDLEEVKSLVERYGISNEKVMLMPQATSAEELRGKGSWLASRCSHLNYGYTTRLQVQLWGNKRGV